MKTNRIPVYDLTDRELEHGKAMAMVVAAMWGFAIGVGVGILFVHAFQ